MRNPDPLRNRYHPDYLGSDMATIDWSHCKWEPAKDREMREKEEGENASKNGTKEVCGTTTTTTECMDDGGDE
jgi:hypothetical protein